MFSAVCALLLLVFSAGTFGFCIALYEVNRFQHNPRRYRPLIITFAVFVFAIINFVGNIYVYLKAQGVVW